MIYITREPRWFVDFFPIAYGYTPINIIVVNEALLTCPTCQRKIY
jgi:hypothetical protein